MVPERAVDGTFILTLLRCVNCGKVVYPTVKEPVDDEQ